ncbi:MAG: 16S rRNA (guanine1516-N2)-methyltransferase [Arenicella sp.]|jgi:16S rRNA (guanine1516-N2)-methyltransferase
MQDSAIDTKIPDALIDVAGVCVELHGLSYHYDLSLFSKLYRQNSASVQSQLRIIAQLDGLHCEWLQADAKSLKYYIDIDKFTQQQRSYPAAKQGALNQALGKKTKRVLDATGGWGGDALLMCAQGYEVTLIERNPVMALLLNDAMRRLAMSEWAQENQLNIPRVIHDDAIRFLQYDRVDIDCIYLDPMFPPKRKKSAAVNKRLQLLQWMVGSDLDASQLVKNAMNFSSARVVVKRPGNAKPLIAKPSQQFLSKLVHYDVYLNSQFPSTGDRKSA